MRISIVVLAYGNRAVTERCLESLAAALGDELGRSIELVLVDNDSPDDTGELFTAWEDRAVVVRLPENRNYSGGNNAGARAATGEVVVFLNNDTEVPEGAIEAVAGQAAEPGVGVAGARLLYPDGTIQHAGVVHRATQLGPVLPFHLFHHEDGDLPQARCRIDLDAVTGACLAIRRALFLELGGFDERYVNGFEDVDLCLRARVAGHRVVYCGDVWLVHHERLTRGASHDETGNARVFIRHWGEMLADDSGTIEALFGLRLARATQQVYNGERPDGVHIAFAGRLRSAAPSAFEARALLAAFAAAEIDVAARTWGPIWEEPVEEPAEWLALQEAQARVKRPDAATIHVAGGGFATPPPELTVARLATPPRRGGALRAEVVWAASPSTIDGLVADGVSPARVEWLPPPIGPLAPGAGGGGILCLLPAHDMPSCRGLLEALARVRDWTVRLLPTARTPSLVALTDRLLPEAELLVPAGSERAFADLAAGCDIVCGDDGDPFERRLLLAAGTGAATVTTRGGPSDGVLGSRLTVGGWTERADVSAALERAVDAVDERRARREVVMAACGPEVMAERLRVLSAGLSPELPSLIGATAATAA